MPGDDMAGWLALHGLTAAEVVACLNRAPGGAACAAGGVQAAMPATLQQAWPRVCQPLAPWLAPDVLLRLLSCRPVPPPAAARGRAFTLPAGPDGLPVVAAPWSGQWRDLMRLAHEAGHAAQALQGPPGSLPPPVLRETCAFLAERALAARAGGPLAAIWQADTARLLGPGAAGLRAALADPATPYDYGWNYPLARHLATALPEAACPALFAGTALLPSLMA